MTYVPGFDADIVISFADADNAQGTEALAKQVAMKWPDQKQLAERVQELEQQLAAVASGNVAIEIRGIGKGWVSGFAFVLQEFIEQILGERVDIEFCSESASRDAQARVGKCAVLLSAISPASVEESVLRGHIESFLGSLGETVSEVPARERAFAVEKLPASSQAAIARFDRPRTWEMWVEDPATGETCELPSGLSHSEAPSEAEERDEREFLKKTYEMARSIAEVLRSMRPVETIEPSEEIAAHARREAESEVAAIAEGATQRIEEQRLEPRLAPVGSDPAMVAPATATEMESEPAASTASEPPSETGSDSGHAAEVPDATDRLTIYVDYDERDLEATKVFEDFLVHYLNKKYGGAFTLLTPLLRSGAEREAADLGTCEQCGRQVGSKRPNEQNAIDLGFLRRVRQAHVTLVLVCQAPPSWAEGRLEKILQFETDPRQTPEVHKVESLARALYVVLPKGEERRDDRTRMRRWKHPFQQDFAQLPETPKDSFDPKPLEAFFGQLTEQFEQPGPDEPRQ